MKRKDKVYSLLKELTIEKLELFSKEEIVGVDTLTLEEKLKIGRNNVSKELNELVLEDKVLKIKGKPVLYLAKEIIENKFFKRINVKIFENYNSLNDILNIEENKSLKIKEENLKTDKFGLIGEEGSLKNAINQAKAAVIYPPKGLHTLIVGTTGVGKSTFAETMYRYSIQKKILTEGAPFIIFNCADYAENKQLLLSQLFGYIKGAFTGADRDKIGLVEKANGGILFLDEVHRLPAEGQEMLFYLIDKGMYRRLGETTSNKQSNIMLILATTEKPEEIMLQTFLRRIPVIIKLPSLDERSEKEKIELIQNFFLEESKRLKKPIVVSKEVIKAFLLYNCPGNIGQLKSDIQLVCAKAFLEYMTYKKAKLEIKINQLSSDIREGLLELKDKRLEIIKDFDMLSKESIIFDGVNQKIENKNNIIIENKYNLDFYKVIKNTWQELENKGYSKLKIKDEIERRIQKYSYSLINKCSFTQEETFFNQIVNISILEIVEENMEKFYKIKTKNNKMLLVLSLHIQHLIERVKEGNCLKHPEKFRVKEERTQELEVSKKILEKIQEIYNIIIPEDEAYYLATFIYLLYNKSSNRKVGILVIMHGETTATSMTNVSNELLKVKHARALDMSLNEKVHDVLDKAIEIVKEIDEGKGVLILGDMGSTLNFSDMITERTGIKTKVIEMTSTSIVIEATRKAMNPEINLEELYQGLLNIIIEILNDKYGSGIKTVRYFDNILIENLNKTLIFLNGEKAYKILNQVLEKICNSENRIVDDAILVKFIYHCSCMIERVILKEKNSKRQPNKKIEENLYRKIVKEFKIVEETFGIEIPEIEYRDIFDLFKIHFDTQEH
ncbi:sigma-54-dependent transcriptional regulator [Fusobacterium sp.]|uniref:sigma-54-dependent transcriptional regulator n=1 Tax=Fusobacterium sp. TaxID=68766 RepID=UPI002614B064|nr:sigma-54-dependent transcriptional regulator [Fusobacterium sp.]